MDDDQKRDLMDVLAEVIQMLGSMDDAKRHRAISSLQYIYNCLASECRGSS
jgi:hypothetical protein